MNGMDSSSAMQNGSVSYTIFCLSCMPSLSIVEAVPSKKLVSEQLVLAGLPFACYNHMVPLCASVYG